MTRSLRALPALLVLAGCAVPEDMSGLADFGFLRWPDEAVTFDDPAFARETGAASVRTLDDGAMASRDVWLAEGGLLSVDLVTAPESRAFSPAGMALDLVGLDVTGLEPTGLAEEPSSANGWLGVTGLAAPARQAQCLAVKRYLDPREAGGETLFGRKMVALYCRRAEEPLTLEDARALDGRIGVPAS